MDNEIQNIPYIFYEAEQARNERHIKRLIIALIISITLIFASNAIWLWAWCQYDYSSDETSTITTVEQDAKDGGNANYIGKDGDINNGISKSDRSKEGSAKNSN